MSGLPAGSTTKATAFAPTRPLAHVARGFLEGLGGLVEPGMPTHEADALVMQMLDLLPGRHVEHRTINKADVDMFLSR